MTFLILDGRTRHRPRGDVSSREARRYPAAAPSDRRLERVHQTLVAGAVRSSAIGLQAADVGCLSAVSTTACSQVWRAGGRTVWRWSERGGS